MEDKTILVAYFSAGGVTANLAKEMAKQLGADLFEIKPQQPYTSADLNWNSKSSRSTVEMSKPYSRPAIAEKVEDMDQYKTVLVGFPIWWYVAPRIISTFFESYDFSGKTIALFATSGGSGMGKSEQILKPLVSSSAKWLPGKKFDGIAEMKKWLQDFEF